MGTLGGKGLRFPHKFPCFLTVPMFSLKRPFVLATTSFFSSLSSEKSGIGSGCALISSKGAISASKSYFQNREIGRV